MLVPWQGYSNVPTALKWITLLLKNNYNKTSDLSDEALIWRSPGKLNMVARVLHTPLVLYPLCEHHLEFPGKTHLPDRAQYNDNFPEPSPDVAICNTKHLRHSTLTFETKKWKYT